MIKKPLLGLGIILLMVMTSSLAILQEPNKEIHFNEKDINSTLLFNATSGHNYQYPMLTDTCNGHYLRMRVYYETGLLPDWITIIPYDIYVGFYEPLTQEQETILTQVMQNPDICFKPLNLKYNIHTRITPQALSEKFTNVTGKKMMYYSDGNTVSLLIFDELTPEEINALKNVLRNMWEVEVYP